MQHSDHERSLELFSRRQNWEEKLSEILELEETRLGKPSAWFLGPKAENAELLRSLISSAIDAHCEYRKSYFENDPKVITREEKDSTAYKEAKATLEEAADKLNRTLQKSAPIASMRSHGHMLWDQVLPAMVGYFAGMLYNQNNVAAEASPVTTYLETVVGNQLCRMLEYNVPGQSSKPINSFVSLSEDSRREPIAWGHITCDGSVANIEALWAARNVKFFGVALKAALETVDDLELVRDITVRLLDGNEVELVEIDDPWTVLNLTIDELVALPDKIVTLAQSRGARHFDNKLLNKALEQHALPRIGMIDFYQKFMSQSGIGLPVAMVPSTAHYSWPKAGTLLGIGQNQIIPVYVDFDARMNIELLEKKLKECVNNKQPVIAVVAVIGTTEESAVDPLDDIVRLREDFRNKEKEEERLDFAIHCDAAWGGYFHCMNHTEPSLAAMLRRTPIPEFHMSEYVTRQYKALHKADSITVDPHKSGFTPYPAGALCYRNSALRNMVSLAAPVVLHDPNEPSVGIFGIEGSKPGAAAASVFLAHQVIPLTREGYGQILGQCVWTSKRMYCRLRTMEDRDEVTNKGRYKIAILQRLPAERKKKTDKDVDVELEMIREFVALDNKDLENHLNDPKANKARELFEDLGSDQVILAFAFNFRDKNGWNQDVEKLNNFNKEIFEICSITSPEEDLKNVPLILTASQFDKNVYGSEFVNAFAQRLGVDPPFKKVESIAFLISTSMNPWTTDVTFIREGPNGEPLEKPEDGDFLEVVENELRKAVYKAAEEFENRVS